MQQATRPKFSGFGVWPDHQSAGGQPIKKKQLDELEAYIREYRKRYEPGDRE
jgi:hypothetical protein